jgi:hypothetical protein
VPTVKVSGGVKVTIDPGKQQTAQPTLPATPSFPTAKPTYPTSKPSFPTPTFPIPPGHPASSR